VTVQERIVELRAVIAARSGERGPSVRIEVPTAASIVIGVLVVAVVVAIVVSALRRRRERRLIDEIIGRAHEGRGHEPDRSSDARPDATRGGTRGD